MLSVLTYLFCTAHMNELDKTLYCRALQDLLFSCKKKSKHTHTHTHKTHLHTCIYFPYRARHIFVWEYEELIMIICTLFLVIVRNISLKAHAIGPFECDP